MKNFYFLCALPRTGATFLSSIINQSKQIQVTANSIVPDILLEVLKIKNSNEFLNFPYHLGIDNVLINVFNNYFQNINCKSILDKGPWGTPFNLEMLKFIFEERKFVILVRPVLECLASLVKAKNNNQSLEDYCNFIMDKNRGILGKNIYSIQNILDKGEKHLIISYDDILKDMQKQIDNIFDFLNIEKETFKLNNFDQFSFDNLRYDDEKISGDYHTIRTDKIIKRNYNIEDYLPKEIIKKYEHIDIWTTRVW
jgi:hypothetical protein